MEQITHLVVVYEMTGTDRQAVISENINVPFIPTHIQFSNIYYEATAPDDTMYILSTNLIKSLDGRVGVIVDKASLNQSITFTNNQPINGEYQFNIDRGGLRAGDFAMSITFIKK